MCCPQEFTVWAMTLAMKWPLPCQCGGDLSLWIIGISGNLYQIYKCAYNSGCTKQRGAQLQPQSFAVGFS